MGKLSNKFGGTIQTQHLEALCVKLFIIRYVWDRMEAQNVLTSSHAV